jgi:hypothetical protein
MPFQGFTSRDVFLGTLPHCNNVTKLNIIIQGISLNESKALTNGFTTPKGSNPVRTGQIIKFELISISFYKMKLLKNILFVFAILIHHIYF